MKVTELVKHYFPSADDEAAKAILWECTGWPAFWQDDPLLCLVSQLRDIAERSGRDVGLALELSNDDLDHWRLFDTQNDSE